MMRRTIRRKRGGFTLIELLLVAGILAVLAAFAIPALWGQAEKAKRKIAEAAVGRNGPIAKALEAYKSDMGRYPDTDEGIAALMQPKNRADDERYDGPYVQNDEIKDPWGYAFEYRSPGEFHEDGYDLWSKGPDGVDDGGKEDSDDVKNWIER
jgi:general secretion pathway protein G